jgi:hypothetical protein
MWTETLDFEQPGCFPKGLSEVAFKLFPATFRVTAGLE